MRCHWVALSLFALALSVGRAAAEDVAAELARAYSEDRPLWMWKGSARELDSPDPAEARRAAERLVALFEQAYRDRRDTSPASARHARAGQMIHNVAPQIADAAPTTPACLPLYEWFLTRHADHNATVEAVLHVGMMSGPEVDRLRVERAADPASSLYVREKMLEQIKISRTPLPKKAFVELCQHPSERIRTLARVIYKRQEGEAPPAFDPVAAMRSPEIRRLLDEIGSLVYEQPPSDARFIVIRTGAPAETGEGDEKEVEGTYGWLVRESRDTIALYLPDTRVKEYGLQLGDDPPLDRPNRRAPAPLPPGQPKMRRSATSADPLELVERLERLLKNNPQDGRRDDHVNACDLDEFLLPYWLDHVGKPELAARALLPFLDRVARYEDLVGLARRELGQRYGLALLQAYAGDRDYDRAFALAGWVVERFPEASQAKLAARLRDQLPRRRNDFNELRLPTHAEWADLRAGMSRAEQIDYLCRRLRLVSCKQGFGWSTVNEPQFAEARGMDDEVTGFIRQGQTAVINPYCELTGADESRDYTPPGVGLTVADIPQLVEHLREDWYTHHVTHPVGRGRARDTHRRVQRTRPLIAGVINSLARKTLLDPTRLDDLPPEEFDAALRAAAEWGRANAHKGRADLEWDALSEELTRGAPWGQVSQHVRALFGLGQRDRVLPVLRQYLAASKEPSEVGDLLRFCREHAPEQGLTKARQWVGHPASRVRLEALLLCLEAGDGDPIREALVREMLQGNDSEAAEVARALLDDSAPKSRELAVRLFERRGLGDLAPGTRVELFRRFAARGRAEPYRFYRNRLLSGGPAADETLVEVADHFAVGRPDLGERLARCPSQPERLAELRKWLEEHLAPQ